MPKKKKPNYKKLEKLSNLSLSLVPKKDLVDPSCRVLKVVKPEELARPEGSVPTRSPFRHELEIDSRTFQAVLEYRQRYLMRETCEDLQVKDTLLLHEVVSEARTGRECFVEVLFVSEEFYVPGKEPHSYDDCMIASISEPVVYHRLQPEVKDSLLQLDGTFPLRCVVCNKAPKEPGFLKSCPGRPRVDPRDEDDG